MTGELHVHVHLPESSSWHVLRQLKRQEILLKRVLMHQEEQAALELVKAQLVKVQDEYRAQKAEDAAKIAELNVKIAELQDVLIDNVDPVTAKALLDEIAVLAQALDAERVDVAPVEEPTI